MKKELKESINIIKNYEYIEPVEFDDYTKTNNAYSINSEVMLKGGMNLYGYSYEFNVLYF